MLSVLKKVFAKLGGKRIPKEQASAPVLGFIGEENPAEKRFFSAAVSVGELLALKRYFLVAAPDLWEEVELCLPENLNLKTRDMLSYMNDVEICFSCSEDRLGELAYTEETYTEYCGVLWKIYHDGETDTYYNPKYVKVCSDEQNPTIVRYIGKTTADGRLSHGRCYEFEEAFDGKYVGFINNKGDYDVEEKEKFIYVEE